MKKKSIIILYILFVLIGCSSKTYLSNTAKSINPYKTGQNLTFKSNTGLKNSISIIQVYDNKFPEGLGQFLNEVMGVVGFRTSTTLKYGDEVEILTLIANNKTNEERIDFCLSLRNTYINMNYIEVENFLTFPPLILETPYGIYNDVVKVENNTKRKVFEDEIVEFYWSKSKGYIKLIQKNRVEWILVE